MTVCSYKLYELKPRDGADRCLEHGGLGDPHPARFVPLKWPAELLGRDGLHVRCILQNLSAVGEARPASLNRHLADREESPRAEVVRGARGEFGAVSDAVVCDLLPVVEQHPV
jgi:hypothetical protein